MRFSRVDWENITPFRISYRTVTCSETVQVELEDDGYIGRGEGEAVFYRGETVDGLLEQLASVEKQVGRGITRADLQQLLGPGGARNALDCALWDLEAKRTGRRAWQMVGLSGLEPLTTSYTLSVDTPEAMAQAATAAHQYSLLKLKLTGAGDPERVSAVRRARPDATLLVDANQAWTTQQLHEFTPQLVDLGVKLIEQPLPVGKDDVLSSFARSIPICADESCQHLDSLPLVASKYEYINIKLDKTGGLTGALELAHAAQRQGLRLMVGCMGGSSLAMAPAFLIGQLCDMVDLDAPLLTKTDMANAIRYEGNRMFAPDSKLWG